MSFRFVWKLSTEIFGSVHSVPGLLSKLSSTSGTFSLGTLAHLPAALLLIDTTDNVYLSGQHARSETAQKVKGTPTDTGICSFRRARSEIDPT